MEKIFFTNPRGQKLCGIVVGPEDAKAAVLLISGYASGKDEWGKFMVRYASALNNAGFMTLRFDRSGIGESEGDFVESTLETEMDDCIAAYNFLKGRCNDVFAAGHSMGGVLVTMLAGKVVPKAVVSSAPAASIKECFYNLFTDEEISMFEKQGRLAVPEAWESFGVKFFGYKYWKDFFGFDITKYSAMVKSPTLVACGTADAYVAVDDAKLVFNSLKSEKKLEIIEGAKHAFEPHEEKFFAMVVEWFKKHL